MAVALAAYILNTLGVYGAAGYVTLASITTLASVISFVAVTAASMAVSKLLAPKAPSFADSSLSTRSQMIRSPISARQAIYGQCKASGVIVYISTTGNKNQYLHLVIAIAGHECEELGDVYLNDEKIITGSGNTVDGASRYLNKISIVKHLGTASNLRSMQSVGRDRLHLHDWK